MREIKLTQGKVALVDNDDYDCLMRYKWSAHRHGTIWYARTTAPGNVFIYMHRMVLKPPKGMDTDHIDGNGLNNKRINLMAVTRRQNCQNRHHPKSSKYPGVYFVKHKDSNKKPWHARIQIDGIRKHLGHFTTEEEAFDSYRVAVNGITPERAVASVLEASGNGAEPVTQKSWEIACQPPLDPPGL